MNLLKNKTMWILATIVLIIGGGILFLSNLGSSFCQRTDIETILSPDGTKKVITFSYNCGPTVGESVHASVIKTNEKIDINASGNALSIDSNHGQAWPKDEFGRIIIRPVWNSQGDLTLYYSFNSRIFYQKNMVDGVKITISPITK